MSQDDFSGHTLDRTFSSNNQTAVSSNVYLRSGYAKFVDRYLIGRVLGEGSYGKVKEALDTESLIRRAIKIVSRLRIKKIINGEQNIEQEIQLLSELRHRNILKMYDIMSDNSVEKIYLVLEFCVCTVADMVETAKRPLPLWQAQDYFCQLLDAVHHIHSLGIIHKDIKPANLLVDMSGCVKLSDFSVSERLSLFMGLDGSCTSSPGSPVVQSPEVVLNQVPFSGYKLDAWSCGITLFYFVTYSYPFDAVNVFKLFDLIGACEIDFGRMNLRYDYEGVAADLIKLLLTKEPDFRISVGLARRHDFCSYPFVKASRRKSSEVLSNFSATLNHVSSSLSSSVNNVTSTSVRSSAVECDAELAGVPFPQVFRDPEDEIDMSVLPYIPQLLTEEEYLKSPKRPKSTRSDARYSLMSTPIKSVFRRATRNNSSSEYVRNHNSSIQLDHLKSTSEFPGNFLRRLDKELSVDQIKESAKVSKKTSQASKKKDVLFFEDPNRSSD